MSGSGTPRAPQANSILRLFGSPIKLGAPAGPGPTRPLVKRDLTMQTLACSCINSVAKGCGGVLVKTSLQIINLPLSVAVKEF